MDLNHNPHIGRDSFLLKKDERRRVAPWCNIRPWSTPTTPFNRLLWWWKSTTPKANFFWATNFIRWSLAPKPRSRLGFELSSSNLSNWFNFFLPSTNCVRVVHILISWLLAKFRHGTRSTCRCILSRTRFHGTFTWIIKDVLWEVFAIRIALIRLTFFPRIRTQIPFKKRARICRVFWKLRARFRNKVELRNKFQVTVWHTC